MNSHQEASYNMFRSANQIGLDNNVYIATIAEMDTGFTGLQTRVNNLAGLISLQAAVISGIAVDKNDLKETMARLTFNYAGPGRAWAAQNGDDTTYNALNVAESKILKQADDVAGPVCSGIYTILNANAALLTPFGLTAPMLGELNNAILDYIAIVPLPHNAVNNRKTYTTNIETQLKDTSDFLDRQLDNIVRGQINANPDFVSDYFNAREIIDAPVHSTTFKITVVNAAGAVPLLNTRAEMVGTTKIAFTDLSGLCELKQFKGDTYTVLVTLTGFVPSQQIVEIKTGETIELTFTLTAI
jgi:hypothetical protein